MRTAWPASLDRRTRRDADVVALGPEEFFAARAPDLVARHGPLVAAGMAALGASPLTLRVDGTEHSLVLDGDRLAVVEGPATGALVVTFTRERFSSFAQQQITFLALNLGALLDCTGGHDDDLEAWDSLWPAFLDGRPVVDPDLTFVDRHGAPLDLHRSFARDDDPADVAHFLREAGYVHLRGWLDPYLMATIADEMDAAVGDHAPGDGRSWWATLDDGTEACVRLQEWVERSPSTKAMLEGEAWAAAGRALAGDEVLEPTPAEGRCIEALFKPLGVTRGISDIAWHRDCAFGRCSYECAGLTAGTAVTPGGHESGLLRVVAGSHRVLMPSEWARDRSYLPIVDLPTEAGDITVHLSCTLHEARPPVSAPRKVMYGGFAQLPGKAEAAAGATELWEIRELIGGPDAPPPSRPVSAGRTHGA